MTNLRPKSRIPVLTTTPSFLQVILILTRGLEEKKIKRRKREQEIENVVFNTDSYSVSRLQSIEGAVGYMSFWLSLWIGDNSQNSVLGLHEIGRTEWSIESKGRMERSYKMRDVQNTFLSCSNKRFYSNHKISDVEVRESGDVLIMCACLSLYLHVIFSSVSTCICVENLEGDTSHSQRTP